MMATMPFCLARPVCSSKRFPILCSCDVPCLQVERKTPGAQSFSELGGKKRFDLFRFGHLWLKELLAWQLAAHLILACAFAGRHGQDGRTRQTWRCGAWHETKQQA